MVKQVGAEEVVFEFLVQLQKDPVKMPVEDALTEWKESDSPFVRVALLRIPRQDPVPCASAPPAAAAPLAARVAVSAGLAIARGAEPACAS
jgi:hypothetical protein